MGIQSDSGGFLIGERRLKEMAQGVSKTQDNTKKILQILVDQFNELLSSINQSSTSVSDILERSDRRARPSQNGANDERVRESTASRDTGADTSSQRDIRYTREAIEQVVDAANDLIDSNVESIEADRRRTRAIDRQTQAIEENTQANDRTRRRRDNISSVEDRANQARERDSNGRFTSGAEDKSLFGKVKSLFGGTNGIDGDVSGVDPTIDALAELKTVFNPVGRVFGKMSAKAISVFAGRTKKRRNDEILPEEQAEANAREERGDRQRNKLLEKLIKAVRGMGGGGGLSSLLGRGGGLLGRGLGLLGKGGKALLKRLPLIGALVGGGALAMNWGGLDSKGKGKGIGEIVGTVVGGALGSFFGPLGTVLGGVLGNKLGGIFGSKVGEWTDHLKSIDFGGLFTKAMNGLKEAGKNIAEAGEDLAKAAKNPFATLANLGISAVGYMANKVKSGVGFGGGGASGSFGGGSTGFSTDRFAPLLDMIAVGESKHGAFGTSGYDAVYSGAKVKPSKPISQMTVGEVKAYQQQLINAGSASTAVGRYQFIRNKGAFGKMASEAGIKDTDIFDQATQDRLAIHYFGGEKQLDKWIQTGNHAAITNKSAQQWASMKNTRGVGNYDGDGLNKARHGGLSEIAKASEQIRLNKAPETAHVQAAIPLVPAIQSVPGTPSTSTATKEAIAKPKAMPVAAKPVQTSVIFPNGINKPSTIKVPKITPELMKTKAPVTAQASARQSDDVVAQVVSDRALAHVMAGGLGYSTLNA